MANDQSDPGRAALLRVEGVTVRFGGILALNNVSFDVRSGEICALIGPNGAGKSTLFNCLSRLYECDSGIGRTFQNLALFRTMTVRENVLLGSHSRHHAGFLRNAFRLPGVARIEAAARARADGLMDFLQLGEFAERVVADLPFGTQKRVELARALASEPQLLLLDEPACGLNHEELESLGALIRDIRDRLKVTVLLVEHHMGLVMGLSDRVVALNFGKKIAEGTPAEVRRHPEVIRAYLGAEPEVSQ